MKLFKKKKKEETPEVKKTIFDTTFLPDLIGVTAIDYTYLNEYASFQKNFEGTDSNQLSNSKADFLNEDMLDPTIDSFELLQLSNNRRQKVSHDYTNKCIIDQINKYKIMDAIYIDFINKHISEE